MKIEEMGEVIREIKFMDYGFVITQNGKGAIYLQARYEEPCIMTERVERQYTRKWLLSEHMTKSELVQTAFKCCLTSMEHRTRKMFMYRGRRIFGPHYDVDKLWEICRNDNMDVRKPDAAQTLAAIKAFREGDQM